MDLQYLLLPLIAAIWASATLFFSINNELNKIRDRILMGRTESMQITIEHRRTMLKNDWIPLAGLITSISLLFATVVLLLPLALAERDRHLIVWAVCVFAAFPSFGCGAIWLIFGWKDYRFMNTYLDRNETTLLENEKPTDVGTSDSQKPLST